MRFVVVAPDTPAIMAHVFDERNNARIGV